MHLQIDTSSRTPIYRQLSHQIREAIARGKLQPGEKLPSVRELSRQVVVNPNTHLSRCSPNLSGKESSTPGRAWESSSLGQRPS